MTYTTIADWIKAEAIACAAGQDPSEKLTSVTSKDVCQQEPGSEAEMGLKS